MHTHLLFSCCYIVAYLLPIYIYMHCTCDVKIHGNYMQEFQNQHNLNGNLNLAEFKELLQFCIFPF